MDGNAIIHAGRVSQYHAKIYPSALRRLGIRQRTSRTGSCLDGAAAESFEAASRQPVQAVPMRMGALKVCRPVSMVRIPSWSRHVPLPPLLTLPLTCVFARLFVSRLPTPGPDVLCLAGSHGNTDVSQNGVLNLSTQ